MYAYYQQMLPDLIEQDDRTQLDRYLTIYRQTFPETEQMKDVLTAWDQICDDQKKMDELDKKYRSDYSGGMSGAKSAADKNRRACVLSAVQVEKFCRKQQK